MSEIGMCACGGIYCKYCGDPYRASPYQYVTTQGTSADIEIIWPQAMTSSDGPRGWICPRCGVVHAPIVLRCDCKS